MNTEHCSIFVTQKGRVSSVKIHFNITYELRLAFVFIQNLNMHF